MLKNSHRSTINRIIDANINRAKEGLRVCEEVTRFILNNRKLSTDFKKVRHAVDLAVKGLISKKELFKGRLVLKDVGRNISLNELKRNSIQDILFANTQRVKESIRVLEEFSKLLNKNTALKFKGLRYKVYEIEKKAAGKISALRNH
ncbi:MAG: thiamine-phosphate pyrophosphorylase [Candidatus Omnitrophica bacterium]|nr:thiamine-phosphate pyrophosphorylase [Candidatus Omnitrophota bacterium]